MIFSSIRIFTGVLLVLASQLDAAIVAVTGLNQTIPGYGGTNPPPYEIDFDGDGNAELAFETSGSAIDVHVLGNTEIQAIPSILPDLGSDPYPIDPNSIIGAPPIMSAVWFHDPIGHSNFRTCFGSCSSSLWPGNNVANIEPFYAYLGARFLNEMDEWHYAWVHVGINGSLAIGRISAYGWETSPDTPILAGAIPEPSASGLVLLTGLMLVIRRSRANQPRRKQGAGEQQVGQPYFRSGKADQESLRIFTGVLLVLASQLDAAIVAVTGLNQTIPGYGGTNPPPYEIDFDGDGNAELAFRTSGTEVRVFLSDKVELQVLPATPPNLGSFAWPLDESSDIRETPILGASWLNDPLGPGLRACFDNGCLGLWPGNNVANIEPFYAYLGARFLNEMDEWHYAWVHVGINGSLAIGRVSAYGWETSPDTPILAGAIPEPSASGLVLLTGLMLVIRRSRANQPRRKQGAGEQQVGHLRPVNSSILEGGANAVR